MHTVRQSLTFLHPLIRISRPAFLILPVTLVGVGAAAAAYEGMVNPVRTGLALLGLILLHVAVNALNEAADYESGIDQQTQATPFSGGSKTLPEGQLEVQQAYRLGYITAAGGAVIGIWFLTVVGPVLLPILIIGALSVVAYTDYLTQYSLGELSAGAGLGGLPVLGTALVQAGQLPLAAVAASIPAFLLTFNLLLLNEFPDFTPDKQGGRMNLLHRFGRPAAGALYVMTTAAVPGSIIVAVGMGIFPLWALVSVLPGIAAIRPIRWAFQSPTTRPPTAVLRDNVAFIISTNSLLAGGLAIGALGLL